MVAVVLVNGRLLLTKGRSERGAERNRNLVNDMCGRC